MIVQIILSCLVLYYLIVRYKNRRMYELSRQLNNDMFTLPGLGHFYLFIGNSEGHMNTIKLFGRKAFNNGGMSALWILTRLYTVVADPVIADYLSKTCLEKDDLTTLGQSLIGNGSIFAPVHIWRPRRKAIAPNFSSARLNNFVDIFAQQSQILVQNFKNLDYKESVPLIKYITAYAMDSICESTLGVKMGVQKNPNHPFPQAFEKQCRMFVKKALKPYIYETPFYKLTTGYAEFVHNNHYLQDFVKMTVRSKRQKLENEKKNNIVDQNLTFVDLMMKTFESKGSDVEILEESLVLILGGTDTSAIGASYVAVMLSRHGDVQDKVYQELREVFGDSDRPVTANDLTQLKYLDSVIKETVRLYPPAPITIRKLEKDVSIPSGITLLKDSSFVIHNWAINRHPEYWGDDAEEFRPERFSDAPPKHPAAFATFSIGPRGCIGYKYALMSMTTVIIYLVRNFKLLPDDSSDTYVDNSKCSEKEKPLRVKFEVMMRHVDDFKVRLEPRMKSH